MSNFYVKETKDQGTTIIDESELRRVLRGVFDKPEAIDRTIRSIDEGISFSIADRVFIQLSKRIDEG